MIYPEARVDSNEANVNFKVDERTREIKQNEESEQNLVAMNEGTRTDAKGSNKGQ